MVEYENLSNYLSYRILQSPKILGVSIYPERNIPAFSLSLSLSPFLPRYLSPLNGYIKNPWNLVCMQVQDRRYYVIQCADEYIADQTNTRVFL